MAIVPTAGARFSSLVLESFCPSSSKAHSMHSERLRNLVARITIFQDAGESHRTRADSWLTSLRKLAAELRTEAGCGRSDAPWTPALRHRRSLIFLFTVIAYASFYLTRNR